MPFTNYELRTGGIDLVMIVLVLGCLLASRYVYLGLYNSEEEAARYNWLQKQSSLILDV